MQNSMPKFEANSAYGSKKSLSSPDDFLEE